jgi:acetaldehyde dehydrogenase (acetylating)
MAVDKDLVSVQQARDLVEAAHRAQETLATFDQAKVDRICEAMAQAALREAARLGAMAVEETGYGIPDDKREKNRFAAEDVWNFFKNLRTVGVIAESASVMEIASPRGVVAGIIPSTNPTSTAIFKALISIKSRNSIVMSPHPSATRCITETVNVLRQAAIKEGLPEDAILCLTNATIEGTEALMKHKKTAVILATGGIGLVRAAYSSGKPAFGVGPGNVPVFVERTADVPKAVQDILTGKCFDNGTICASEQAVVADAPIAKQVREEFTRQGAYFLSPAEADQLAKIVATPQRTLNPKIVGKSVEFIAGLAGLSVPPNTRCLIADVGGVGREHPLSMEKLSPILAFYVEDGVERAAARCFEILSYGGMGHTAGIHTRSRDMARVYGMEMPASRVCVNTPTTHGAIGFSTALPPSMTLGCGSWGGNVTSDNISPIHLLDIKRVAFETRPVKSARPVVAQTTAQMMPDAALRAPRAPMPGVAAQASSTGTPQISREQIAAIVDKFLASRAPTAPSLHVTNSPTPVQPVVDLEANRAQAANLAAPHAEAAPTAESENGASAQTSTSAPNLPPPPAPSAKATPPTSGATANKITANSASANGHRPMDFVCEEDVRRALERGEKIYITKKTIITPAARDLGEASEVFAKV